MAKEITEGPAALVLTATAARRYYLDGASKSDIAAELGVSRFKVARLLDRARATGLVRIELDARGDLDLDLSVRLKASYGLRHCVVQAAAATPRCVWDPDGPDPGDDQYREGWTRVRDDEDGDGIPPNAFRLQWDVLMLPTHQHHAGLGQHICHHLRVILLSEISVNLLRRGRGPEHACQAENRLVGALTRRVAALLIRGVGGIKMVGCGEVFPRSKRLGPE